MQRPQFCCKEVVIAGESFEFFSRDIIQCITALYGDPEFARHLAFAPEKHYVNNDADPSHNDGDGNDRERMYYDMHTGKWWWDKQVSPAAPIIVVDAHLNRRNLKGSERVLQLSQSFFLRTKHKLLFSGTNLCTRYT